MTNALSPKELARAIGVSESSLKRWVDEGVIAATRTSGGHRRIPRNVALAFARERGYPLLRPDLLGLDEALAVPGGEAAASGSLHAALLEGRAAEARRLVVARFVAGESVAALIDDHMAPAMRAIGELWQHDAAGIFIEHRAVDICTRILDRLRDLLPEPAADAPLAVGGAPEDDPYTLPSLMAATVLAAEGWRTMNLGAHAPAPVLARAAADHQARLVWLALSVMAGPRGVVRETEEALGDLDAAGCGATLVVGGPACRASGRRPPEPARSADAMAELAGLARGLKPHA
jgi:excisionase family DNA binding protein